VRQLLALQQQFGICDRRGASSEDQKEEIHLVPSQGSVVNVRDTPAQIAAKRLPSVRLCGVLAPNDFYVFGPLNKHVCGHRCQTDAEVQEAV
jgi:hypothetical protein